jgi:uncharacterized protein (TIGR00159 family)
MAILDLLKEIGISGFLDIAFMSLLIYSILVWFKRTKSAFVMMGMFMIGMAYLLARQFNLSLTTTVFQGFFAIILIAFVIIFQEEIKHFFEQVASRSLIHNFKERNAIPMQRRETGILVRALTGLAREKIGGLVVIRGKNPIYRHLTGGIDLNGELSEPILRSIFDPHSAGHDGAVIIEDSKITQFACHLPLAKDLRKIQRTGTRHAAALGLAELTDALCLIVSEERGTISAARHGEMREVRGAEELISLLENFYQEVIPPQEKKPWQDFFKKNYREKVVAIAVTVLLWFLFVHGAKLEYRSFRVPVNYANLPSQLIVTQIDPTEVEVTCSGSRRSFYFINRNSIRLYLKLFRAQEGTQREILSKAHFTIPAGLTLEDINPNEVTVRIEADAK